MPVDVGRRTRTITHWPDGGLTSLDNLVLLCRCHHTHIHRAGLTVDHHLTFHRPDDTRIE